MALGVLLAGAGPQHQRAAGADILLQQLGPLGGEDFLVGAEQHGVALQVLQGGVVQVEGVHGGVGQLAGHEQLHLAGVGQVAVPGVQLGVEHVVVVLHQAQQGDVLRPGHLLDGLHPGVEPLELRQLPVGPVVIVQQAVPVII